MNLEFRARIKEACNLLRQLVPGMSEKTDKATVFEFAARYVHFLKSHTGAQYDKVWTIYCLSKTLISVVVSELVN